MFYCCHKSRFQRDRCHTKFQYLSWEGWTWSLCIFQPYIYLMDHMIIGFNCTIFFFTTVRKSMENLYICRIRRNKKLENESLVSKKCNNTKKYSLKFYDVCRNLISEILLWYINICRYIELKFAMYFKDKVIWIFKPVTTKRLRVLK